MSAQLALTNQPKTMSSLEIAKLTGKQHKDVLRDIRKILDDAGIQSAQFCADYKDDLQQMEMHRQITGIPRIGDVDSIKKHFFPNLHEKEMRELAVKHPMIVGD